MTLQPAAEASAVDKPAKPAARKRTAAARTTSPRTRKTEPTPVEIVEPIPTPLPAVAAKPPQRSLRAIAGFGLVLAAVAAAALLVVGRDDETPAQDSGSAVAVSAKQLASFAGSLGAPVYWAGPLRSRTLELTRTDAGTFVRYLPAGIAVGGSSRALTVATYPMRAAYTTATRRAKGAGMTSSPTRNGGLAVWSKAQPTSVYVAFRGLPSLIEVYAPQAKEARTLALSGKLRPVH
jgi:hypothetical protein